MSRNCSCLPGLLFNLALLSNWSIWQVLHSSADTEVTQMVHFRSLTSFYNLILQHFWKKEKKVDYFSLYSYNCSIALQCSRGSFKIRQKRAGGMTGSELSGLGRMRVPAQEDPAARGEIGVSYTLSFHCWRTDLLADLSSAAFECYWRTGRNY